jgi:signal transduction histidine kinase
MLVLTVMIATGFLAAGYMFLSRDAYERLKLSEMLPKAQALDQLCREYEDGNLNEGAFTRLADKMIEAANASTFVTDAEGKVIYLNELNTQPGSIPEDGSIRNIIREVLAGNTIQLRTELYDSYSVLLVGVPVTGSDGTVRGSVFLIKPSSEIALATGRLNASLLLTIAVVIPVVILISTLGIRRITYPLRNMAQAAILMSKGDFKVRVSEDESGEVGLLARAFNDLCDTLSQTIFQLRAEKSQLNQILHALNDGVAALDELGTLTHYNSSLMKMFGAVVVNKREDLIKDPSIWKVFDKVLETGEQQTVKYAMPANKMLWITISPVVTEDNARVGVVGLFKDMTETERLESMRNEYIANISHELRSPLTAVRGLLEPLSDNMVADEETRQRYYKIMLHEVMRLNRLISDMMMISRLQSGTEYMELSRVDVDELVKDMAQGYANAANNKGIALHVDAPDVPDALTDPDRVEQVLVILFDNAMRFTEKGGSITLRVENKDRLCVSVCDTGCGIKAEDLPHVFDRFYKANKARNDEGTGLGLSIAKFILDKLGETIYVDSEPGKGACFTFTLKKYVANAIALGPASEERGQGTAPQEVSSEKSNALKKKGRGAEDAPYEVIGDKNQTKKKDREA